MANENNHQYWMQHCLSLARKGTGRVHPNPMVGCVIVSENGKILGEGAHLDYGQAHAEVNALAQAPSELSNVTLYVNLEPCSHHGKTPPCVEAVLASGVRRIVIGMPDPNPKVAGQGIEKLKAAGLEVLIGVEEAACQKLNEAFCWQIQHRMPFVVLKQAMTLDGYIATSNGDSQWITNESARRFVHQLRAESDAILSTTQSVIADNAQLTVRDTPLLGRPPLRVILDRQARLSPELALFQASENAGEILIATHQDSLDTLKTRFSENKNVKAITTPKSPEGLCLKSLLKNLSETGLTQILVEAGSQLAGSLLEQQLVQKLWLMYGNVLMADPHATPAFSGRPKIALSEAHAVEITQTLAFDGNIAVEAYVKTST